MSNQDTILWHLRIFGPCGIAELMTTARKNRTQVVGAMTRLRDIGHAEWISPAIYRVTPGGERYLESLQRPLLTK